MRLIIMIIFCVGLYHTWQWLKKQFHNQVTKAVNDAFNNRR